MAKDLYLGKYEDPKKALEELKKLYPCFRVEEGRDSLVRCGNEFANSQSRQAMSIDMAEQMLEQQNINDSMEARRAKRDELLSAFQPLYKEVKTQHPEWDIFGYWEEYDIDGCVEEPDAPKVHIAVRRFHREYMNGPYATLFMIPGGGLFGSDAFGFCSAPMSKFLGCQIVSVQYRTTVDAKYPAAVNDLHAAYQWMISHAKELCVDTDRIVLYGMSSGGHLAAALPFRLKRYGWCGAPMPRGVVVEDGFFDDRETTRSMRLFSRTFDGFNNRAANMMYMGENFASGFIGPEAYANHANVSECKGLPPYMIYEGQDNCGCDPALEFIMKLNEAGIFCSFYMCGGTTHVEPARKGDERGMRFLNFGSESEFVPLDGMDTASQIEHFLLNGIMDLFENDMRRLQK